ncbi:hypothetical protein SKAU_G00249340 [Synaphobranchus kaupii]|uniref:Uncharacterized protein n=1 Tax=Synaphobranchus kaupii TaxID=118154 RepID=A0A9Q1IPM9_SYNKA|nr:hypothetical protein SKAU_G00249340 [Synaphobranchus kaupii]
MDFSYFLFRPFIGQHNLDDKVSEAQAAKKLENLKAKYKELKDPPTGSGTDRAEDMARTWKWFPYMHEVLGTRASICPPVVIGLLPACRP